MCEKIRCSWAGDLQIYVEYHDQEWGRPVHEDNKLFEMLILEGMQAGLSWITVLKKERHFEKRLIVLIRLKYLFTMKKKFRNCWQMKELLETALRWRQL